MFGKIRELFDRSGFLDGSKLKAEADAVRVIAKKKLLLGLKGAFAAGPNFVGKIRPDGKADILLLQPSGVYGVNCHIPQDPRTAFHYKISSGSIYLYQVQQPYKQYAVSTNFGIFDLGSETDDTFFYGYGTYTGSYAFVRNEIAQQSNVIYSNESGGIGISSAIRVSIANQYLETVVSGSPNIHLRDVTQENLYSGEFIYIVGLYEYKNYYGTYIHEFACITPTSAIGLIGELDNKIKTIKNSILYIRDDYGFFVDDTSVSGLSSIAPYLRTILTPVKASSFIPQDKAVALIRAHLNDGEVIYAVPEAQGYADVYYQDDVTPRLPPSAYTGYDSHVIRHRAWRNTQHDAVISELDSGVMPKNLAIAIMNGAPWSTCVGIGSRWKNYRITQDTSTPAAGTTRYTRTLFARNADDVEVQVSTGYCDRVTISTVGATRYRYDFSNFLAMRPIGFTSYLNGTYALTYPENLSVSPADFDGMPDGVVVIDGSYDTLYAGLSDSQAQTVANSLGSVPQPAAPSLSFSDVDLSALLPDVLTYDKDTDHDGTIEAGEKSATSTKHWIGKGLSKGESLTIFPLSYVAQDGECGMFPQAYDAARLAAIRVYGSYRCRYLGDGEFEVGEFVPLTDDEGTEVPYVEFPYVATATLGYNVIVVAKNTVYDDVLAGRVAQNEAIKGKYDEDIEAGKITMNGIYEWCKLNA